MAWEVPAQMLSAKTSPLFGPRGSRVAAGQNKLLRATEAVLAAIADDVRRGLRETVGIESRLVSDQRYAVEIDLPPGTDVSGSHGQSIWRIWKPGASRGKFGSQSAPRMDQRTWIRWCFA